MIHHGDCLEVLRTLPDNSVDAVVTDPPYGLAFMGKRWDYDVPSVDVWAECLRVLKPGGHLLAFAGTRTQHRMAVRIEDAGFEIRDMIAWVYGSGFPKSMDVIKAIDKAAGAERDVVGPGRWNHVKGSNDEQANCLIRPGGKHSETAPATDAARQWQGWGTALKPALEPITLARKPLSGAVAKNVLAHGTGGLNIDGCRVPTNGESVPFFTTAGGQKFNVTSHAQQVRQAGTSDAGRWPANLIHDGSDEVLAGFPQTASGSVKPYVRANRGGWAGPTPEASTFERAGSSGSAARFFYCAKASKRDRDEGLDGFAIQSAGEVTGGREDGSAGLQSPRAGAGRTNGARNHHPTVKPTDLMRYLCRLVTPPGGVVLDPFMGSGSTGKACALEGFGFIGIEREAEYVEIARARIAAAQAEEEGEPDPQMGLPMAAHS